MNRTELYYVSAEICRELVKDQGEDNSAVTVLTFAKFFKTLYSEFDESSWCNYVGVNGKTLEKAMRKRNMLSRDYYLSRYRRVCAHVICESLGYATPTTAAMIVKDYMEGRDNYCEWIDACYSNKPGEAIKRAIACRKHHKGYMAEYSYALALVQKYLDNGQEPMLASWF